MSSMDDAQDDVRWPEAPTCHGTGPMPYTGKPFAWDAPLGRREPYEYVMRTCSYCGSVHPADLAVALENGTATLHGSDWKYGYPHKFYVHVRNPIAGQHVQIGSSSTTVGDPTAPQGWRRVEEPIMGTAPTETMQKWYNEHLLDLEGDAFERITALLEQHAGIRFWRDAATGKLKYRAPYGGYQRD